MRKSVFLTVEFDHYFARSKLDIDWLRRDDKVRPDLAQRYLDVAAFEPEFDTFGEAGPAECRLSHV